MWLTFLSPTLRAAEDFEKTSLTLRTALHYDPSGESPLTTLAELYRGAGRMEELLGLYESHLAQYPQDSGAALVLARLYTLTKDRRAPEFWKATVAEHPDDAALSWFHALFLEERHDPGSMDEMARAVALETSPSRRALWFAVVMKAAAAAGREELVLAQTKKFLSDGSMTAEQRLRWARQALSDKLRRTSALLLEGLSPESLGADGAIEAALLRAQMLAADGSRPDAVKLLDGILERLAPEHWRRHEILMLRLDLSEASGRDSLIGDARSQWLAPGGKTEPHALALADLLEASHRSHEAFLLLREALAALPESHSAESRLLDAWEHEGLNDEALQWLVSLLDQHSERGDLRLRQVRWLFIAGKNADAKGAFEKLLKTLAPDQQVERGVEMARWLRRRNQLPEAAAVLEFALALAPDRWDLRRELAEMDFALRHKEQAAKLFDGAWSKNLTPDARLETVQFLIAKQLWSEARTLLEPWLKEQSGAFDGRLLLAKIFDKTGEDDHATETLEQARALCDTLERYQAWLTASLDFAESREHAPGWLRHEAALLEPDRPEGWDEKTLARWLALVSEAKAHREEKLAAEMLGKAAQNGNAPADKKLEMEKLRLDLLAAESSNATEVEAGLRALIEKDSAHSEDYRARLILLYHHAGRNDLVRPLLETLNVSRCSEIASLRTLAPLCRELGLTSLALATAERLTGLEPGERAHWTQRLTLLAESGDEEHFRETVRVVQARAADWKLRPEVIELLDAHLRASCWRGILAHLMGDGADLAAARRDVAEAQRAASSPEQSRWMDWTGAFLSARLGDHAATENMLARLAPLDARQWIAFPDGLELSASEGRNWITTVLHQATPRAASAIKAPLSAAGPLAAGKLRWGFTLGDGRTLTRVLAVPGSDVVLLADDRRSLTALQRRTGKMLWSSDGPSLTKSRTRLPSTPVMAVRFRNSYPARSYSGQPHISLPPELEVTGSKICVLRNEALECLDATTGDLLWRGSLADEMDDGLPPLAHRENRLALAGDRAIVWQPGPSVISAYDMRTGRLLWETRVPARAKPPAANAYYDATAALKSGLSVENGRAFVFSDTAAMVDLATGALQWRLATNDLPGFPIDLETQDDPASGGVMAQTTQILMPVHLTSSSGTMSLTITGGFQGFAPGYPYRNASVVGQRWAYGNNFATTFQNAYGTVAILHGDQVWALSGGSTGFVSVMGLPRSLVQFSGTLAGFAGDTLISFDGANVRAQSLRDGGAPRLLASMEGDVTTSVSALASVTVKGTRVYVCDGKKMRVLEARSGALLFEGNIPGDLSEWVKNLPPPVLPPPPPGYGSGWKPSPIQRSYLPQGMYVQDYRGGGTLCRTLAAVTDDAWIFPVRENAVACVQTRADEPSRATPP